MIKPTVIFIIILSIFLVNYAAGQESQSEENETTLFETNNESNETVNESTEIINNVTAEPNNITNESISEGIQNETQNISTALICTDEQCESGCTVCDDGSCHSPEISCIEQLSIEKITPLTIATGEQQLNILVKNTGNVALKDIEAEISGYGIATKEKIPIEIIPSGEKDYTFTKVIVQQTGNVDIIVKLFANKTLQTQQIFQITVQEIIQEEAINNKTDTETTEEAEFNRTAAIESLNETKTEYENLEKLFFEKDNEGYILYSIEEDLKEIKEYLRKAQVAIIEENNVEFEKNILLTRTNLEELAKKLENAEKEKKTLIELMSENLALIGSILGVIISAITVWTITKAHLKKARIINIIKGKQIINVDKDGKVENILKEDVDKKDWDETNQKL